MDQGGSKKSWNGWQQRCSFIQMFLGAAMQTSYVSFPSYNFVLAIWSAYCTTAQSGTKTMWSILMSMLPLSIVCDIVWIYLWTTGTIFSDRLCNSNSVHLLSCGGIEHFPGCRTNQFAFAMLVLNIVMKCMSMIFITKVFFKFSTFFYILR